jgi:hypothetical protein
MIKHISYPSIDQFRNVIASINRQVTFAGLDSNGEAIYDGTILKPTITFKGTVKLHGTNAGVSYNSQEGIWAQSRENIITPQKDNAGFAFFVESNKDVFQELFDQVKTKYDIDTDIYTISIYGEWVGKGIQSGVAISQLEKSLFIFGLKISKPGDESFTSYWLDSSFLERVDRRIYNIEKFETYSIDIDFNMPQLIQNKLGEITEAVEKECPVAKAFGFSGVGEGVVWSVEYKGINYRFKVKGEKHSVSKVKTLAAVDTEKLNSIAEFVGYAVTENRFNQAIEKVFGDRTKMDIKQMGDLIKWMVNDILKEELDTMSANGLEPKDVNKYISAKTREMFLVAYNSTENPIN